MTASPLLAVAAALTALLVAACDAGAPDVEDARTAARLERERLQARAANLQGVLETRTDEFSRAIAEAEERQARLRESEQTPASQPD